ITSAAPSSARSSRARGSGDRSPAPDGRLAVAAIQEVPAAVLHPLGLAGPALARAGEGPRQPARVGTGLRAVGCRDVDRGVAALALARVDPAGVTPAGILRRARPGSREEQAHRGEARTTHARSHSRGSLPTGLYQYSSLLDHRRLAARHDGAE